ncbi:MAG: phage holin family protein, partial [Dehalococcoidia bacterium]
VLTCPLIILTLGLFLLVVNTAMMGLTAWLAGQFDIGFSVDSFSAALLGSIVVSIVSWALSLLTD